MKSKKKLQYKLLKSKKLKSRKSKSKNKSQKGGANNSKPQCKTVDFTKVSKKTYETREWGTNGNPNYCGSSGDGSKIEYNKKDYIPFIRDFLKIRNIQSVVDLGCGDFLIGPLIYADMNLNYTGYDAYKGVIDYHTTQYIPINLAAPPPKPVMPTKFLIPFKREQIKEQIKEQIEVYDIIYTGKLNNITFNFINADFTRNAHDLVSADLCIIKDVLQHLPNCVITNFMDFITTPYIDVETGIYKYRYKYILITNCYDTTPENTIEFRKDIKSNEKFEFSSLSVERHPLNIYNATVVLIWGGTKETSLIDFTIPEYSVKLDILNKPLNNKKQTDRILRTRKAKSF